MRVTFDTTNVFLRDIADTAHSQGQTEGQSATIECQIRKKFGNLPA